MNRVRLILTIIIALHTIVGCYHTSNKDTKGLAIADTVSVQDDAAAIDSGAERETYEFFKNHHYAQNYNFVVKSDSIVLLRQLPEEFLGNLPTDSFAICHGSRLVVVDYKILQNDHVDSIWIQVARDQNSFGWTRETTLLRNVVPDDPISQFISTFSDTHLLVFLIIISIIAISYLFRKIRRKNAKVVHFNDIDSFYPTLLAISVASAATFYSSIQMFSPDTWRHFYFHPSLNPFAVPTMLSVFLASVWAIVIMAIAAVEDVYHKLSPAHATLYLSGLAAVCSANYIIFSITTLYYIGYPLLLIYIAYTIKLYTYNNFYLYTCGKCGAKLQQKGVCPKCGAVNE